MKCVDDFRLKLNGKEYVLVTAGAPGDHQSEPYHVLDAVKVYGRIGENPE